MVVCPFFLQGTCKFGNRCFNEHIKNSNFPIYRQNRGPNMRGRGGRGSPGPRFHQQQEPAYEFYGRMACEQSQRLKNPKGRVTVASRYHNNQPQQNGGGGGGGGGQLNRTIDSKSSVKSNDYLKHNGYGSGRSNNHHDDDDDGDEDDDDLYNGDDDQNLTQENDSVSVSRSSQDSSDDDDEFTKQRRRRKRRTIAATGGRSINLALKPIKASSPNSRSSSTNSAQKDDEGLVDLSEMREWLSIHDEEVNFFRSLIPTMKALDDFQKSSARAQIVQVLHKARYQTVEKK